ncbi:MAG: sigma-70 family RNA polymerase sigma factor [Planctomycetota bacterium]|nr:sigma-70 family RNA polymerase sigma factor [Planctomycetota bacterium]
MAANSIQQTDSPDPHESFLRLWMQHEPDLRAFVRSCCPKAQEVDDVMQEVSVAALRKFSTLDDHAAFGAWACLIARYELLSARRRFARDRLVLAEDIVQLLADEGADELPLRERQLRALDQCINQLPRERRELALAAYCKDTTIRELAAQLNRTEGSLYQLLSRIRKELYRCMQSTLPGAES